MLSRAKGAALQVANGSGADSQHIRMFVLSHLAGPVLGLSLCSFLLLAGFPADYRLAGFAALIALFWAYPAALRVTGRYRLLSLCSLEHLQLTILWATHGYGGLVSPFMLWFAIVPLLAFLYLSPSPRLWLALIATMAANATIYMAVARWFVAAPVVAPADLAWLSILSFACAAAYVGMMAVNFGHILSSRAAIEREAAAHQAAAAALAARLQALRNAGRAKAERLARLGDETMAPLAELEQCCRLLLGRDARPADGEEITELRSIGEASQYLAEVVRDIRLYSDVECGAHQVSPVDVVALLERAAAETRPLIDGRAELIVRRADRASIATDGRLLASALIAVGRHVAQLPLGPRIEWSAARRGEDGTERLVIEIADGAEAAESGPDQRPIAVPASPAGRMGGYGLSLALARRICERLGGSLSAEADPHRRMRFRLEVPVLA